MQRQIALAAVLLASACAAFAPAQKDERFVIYNHGNFTTYGRERFLRLYDTALETIDFKGLYAKTAETLVDEWLSYVAGLPGDTEKARVLMRGMKTSLARE